MTIKNALASVAVRDFASSVKWYAKVLGRPADCEPMSEVAEWAFERGGWLQVYRNESRAGSGSVTLSVTDLAEQMADLWKVGIDPGQPIDGQKVKVVMIKDPDGNSIAFAEALDRSVAQ